MSDTKKTPLSVLSDTAGQGLKIVILILTLVFLFLIPGITGIGFGIAALIKVEITKWVIVFFVLLILAAAASCVAAFYFTYEYFMIDTIRIIYDYLIPVFKLLCGTLAKRIAEGNTGVIKKGYDWSENIADSFQKTYNSKVPKLIRIAIRFILEQIPFADIMYHVSIDANTTDTEALGRDIYTQFDAYLHKRFFDEYTMKWLLWFLPLSAGLQILFIWLMY
jgi:hypothetical protein